jgi:hypothetical protein
VRARARAMPTYTHLAEKNVRTSHQEHRVRRSARRHRDESIRAGAAPQVLARLHAVGEDVAELSAHTGVTGDLGGRGVVVVVKHLGGGTASSILAEKAQVRAVV